MKTTYQNCLLTVLCCAAMFSVGVSAQEAGGVEYSVRAYRSVDEGKQTLKQKAVKAQMKSIRKSEAPDQNSRQVLTLKKLSADDLQKVAAGSFAGQWRIRNRFWLQHGAVTDIEEPVDDGDVKVTELERKREEAAEAKEKAEEAKKLAGSKRDNIGVDEISLSIREDDDFVYFEFDVKIAPDGIIELMVIPRDPVEANDKAYHLFLREAYDSLQGGRSKPMELNGKDMMDWKIRDGICVQQPSKTPERKVIPVAVPKEKFGKPNAPTILDVQVFRWFENDGASLDGKLPGEGSIPVVISALKRSGFQREFRRDVLTFYREVVGRKSVPSLEFSNWTWINQRGTVTVQSQTMIWQRERRAAFLLKSMADLFLAESGFIPKYQKDLKDTAPLYTDMSDNPYLYEFILFGRYREFTQPEQVRKEKAKEAIRDKMFSSKYPDCEVE